MVAKHFLSGCVLSMALATASISASAMEFSKPEDAYKLREHQMELIANYFSDMGAMVRNRKPFNAQQFKTDADLWHSGYDEPFEKASYRVSGSEAKPEIWQHKAEFDHLMAQFAKTTANLKAVAAKGDLKASMPAFKAVADTCGSCHKKFRK